MHSLALARVRCISIPTATPPIRQRAGLDRGRIGVESAPTAALSWLCASSCCRRVIKGLTRACDTVITRDGRFVYFANRDNDFFYSFKADFKTGALTPIGRSNCGGKTTRNFTLDPTERWMLVANQDSNLISVFARNLRLECWPVRERALLRLRRCAFCFESSEQWTVYREQAAANREQNGDAV